MRRRRERAPKTRKLLVVNCVQLVAAAAALVSAQSTIWLWEAACRLGASLCTRPPLDGDCKQRLHVCSAHDGRAGLHDELLAKTIHPCSLSLSLQPTSSPLLHPPRCLSTNLQKLNTDQLSQNMKISALKWQNKLCLL